MNKSKGLLLGIAKVALVIGILGVIGNIFGRNFDSLILEPLMQLDNVHGNESEDLTSLMQFAKYLFVLKIFSLFVLVCYIVAGLLLLKSNLKGQKILIFSSVAAMVIVIFSSVYLFFFDDSAAKYFLPRIVSYTDCGMVPPTVFGSFTNYLNGIVSIMYGLIFPLFFIFGLRAKSVKEQFSE